MLRGERVRVAVTLAVDGEDALEVGTVVTGIHQAEEDGVGGDGVGVWRRGRMRNR